MLYFIKKVALGLSKDRAALVCAIFITVVVLAAIVIPVVSHYDYYSHDADSKFLPPFTGGHWFGTDEFGRDLFVRVWHGVRISFAIGVLVAFIQMLIGTLYGGVAGIFGGLVDEVMMRFADVMYSVPNLVVVVLITLLMGNNELSVIFALSLTDWTTAARVVRGQTLVLKEMEFVQAAKVLGAKRPQIMLKHILPNCSGPILVNLMINIPSAIFAESTLSFLGIGIKPPAASLGTLVNEGFKYVNINYYSWVIFIPLLFIALIMISLNILGDALQKVLDSKS
ncbi:ABC transporter permease [Acetivibrio mesophilus]|uniref:ABC transporter permease n=1 Tax=Acetivibrio mesophilus TaxID=2487273 RepID=A0A4V1K202_9FIRM|nr:ABC transporter permease [Acetivibrio mesophilus]ODM26590.1 diguanylate cyclase [Clostridium sp. Bc-iso-3]RXE58579.1 ABC transporter permease [Acetivibrio mesophilus]HHV29759.1 ABC transporter permease [Clostridium sp.]